MSEEKEDVFGTMRSLLAETHGFHSVSSEGCRCISQALNYVDMLEKGEPVFDGIRDSLSYEEMFLCDSPRGRENISWVMEIIDDVERDRMLSQNATTSPKP